MPRDPADRLRLLAVCVPFALYGYPCVAAFLAESQTPIYFARYSQSLLMLLLANCVVVAGTAWFIRYRHCRVGQAALLAYGVMSFAFVGTSDVAALPYIELVLPLLRLLSAIGLVVLTFFCARQQHRTLSTPAYAIAIGLVVLSVADGLVYVASVFRDPAQAGAKRGYRDDYTLTAIERRDVVFVGDSFVWGAGVEKDERFCSVAELHWRTQDSAMRVYCLGHVGTDLQGYEEILSSIPDNVHARAVYVFYYHNDFPPLDVAWERMTRLFETLSVSSKTFLLVKDLLIRLVALDAHAYQRFLIDNYDPEGKHFARRWQLFDERLHAVYEQARRVASQSVHFVILPLATRLDPYPLTATDTAIAQAASNVGFNVINPIPFLIENNVDDADRFRAGENDNHYNAALNALIARFLVRE